MNYPNNETPTPGSMNLDIDQERVLLNAELLDPSTSSERLDDISRRVTELALADGAVADAMSVASLTNGQMSRLLMDGATSLEVVEEIGRVVQQRRHDGLLPPMAE